MTDQSPIKPKGAAATPIKPPTNAEVKTVVQKPAAVVKSNTIIQYQPSPIKAQHRDERSPGQSDYTPLKLTFLEGKNAGRTLELGVAVEEISQEQTAEWEDQSGEQIRSGSNFKRLSTRTFTVTLTYYDTAKDISHLVENVAHLHEITDGQTTPPTLLWQQGDSQASRVVCTSFHPNYKNPLPKGRGFRFATVELQFKMLAGKGSADALGRPLTSTPLADIARTQTLQQRLKKAKTVPIKLFFAKCLGEKGSMDIANIVENNQQNDVNAIASLSPDAFVQSAIGGIFPKAILADPTLKDKLKRDLASVLAKSEDGIGIEARRLGDAIASGNGTGLSSKVQLVFDGLLADYGVMLDAISKQDLGKDSSHNLFDRSKNPTALVRFNQFGGCGLELRAIGASTTAESSGLLGGLFGGKNSPEENNKKLLEEVNKLIADKNTKDADFKLAFGVSTPGQIKNLRNSAPYTSKEQFIQDASRDSIGLTGYTLWASFIQYHADKLKAKNPETPEA